MNDSEKKKRSPHLPKFYLSVFPALVITARKKGYALAVHGSCIRDLDLIAVPWTEQAVDALSLILALKKSIRAIFHHDEFDHLSPDGDPTSKPHGRKAWSLHFTNRGSEGPYVDVSVMPRRVARRKGASA